MIIRLWQLKDLLSVHFESPNYLSFERAKTLNSKLGDNRLTIPIHPLAQQLIDKYKNKGEIDLGYSFSYKNLQRFINRGLKKMGQYLELSSGICFYSARKTFVQFAFELGIPDGVIDYCLGHSDKSNLHKGQTETSGNSYKQSDRLCEQSGEV